MNQAAQTVAEGRARLTELVQRFEEVRKGGASAKASVLSAQHGFVAAFWQALGWPVDTPLGQGSASSAVCRVHAGPRGELYDLLQVHEQVRVVSQATAFDVTEPEHGSLFAAKAFAWSSSPRDGHPPVCVLSNFERLQVYQVHRPPQLDQPRDGLLATFDLSYTQYVAHFDRLWATFSHDAVTQGSLETWMQRPNTAPSMHDTLFRDVRRWRERLATGLLAMQPELDEAVLDEAARCILDRLLFLRCAADRRIEPATHLPALARSATPVPDLSRLCRQLDARYQHALFSPHISDDLAIHVEVFAAILAELDPTQSPYRFNAMPINILGQIYEAQRGYRIRRHPDVNACTLEAHPSTLKSGGIYYTPPAIVSWMVAETLEPLVDGRSPDALKAFRVLDPACGAGGCVLAAYDALLKHYQRWYEAQFASNRLPKRCLGREVELGADGVLRLTLRTRANLLRDHIFGVDIDGGAVEVARLALTLKCLDQTTVPTPQMPLLLPGSTLPDLTKNLVHGNALMGSECLAQSPSADTAAVDRIQPFDWAQHFTEPFDVILGNPPYLKEADHKQVFMDLKSSRNAKYYAAKMDLWYAFTCQAIDHLRAGGRHAFIVQNNWGTAQSARLLRAKLRAETALETCVDFQNVPVFKQAGIQTMVYVLTKRAVQRPYTMTYHRMRSISGAPRALPALIGHLEPPVFETALCDIDPGAGDEVMTFVAKDVQQRLDHLASMAHFQLEASEVGQGIIGGPDAAFLYPNDANLTPEEQAVMRPHYTTAKRFEMGSSTQQVAYLTKHTLTALEPQQHPHFIAHMATYRARLANRRETKTGSLAWFHLHWPRREDLFKAGPKLVCPTRVERPAFVYVDAPYYASRAVNMVVSDRIDLRFLAGVLNSTVVHYWLCHRGKRLGKMLQIDTAFLRGIPIPRSAELEPKIVAIVDRIQGALARKNVETAEEVREALAHEIEGYEAQLDQFVFELYGVSDDEQAAYAVVD